MTDYIIMQKHGMTEVKLGNEYDTEITRNRHKHK